MTLRRITGAFAGGSSRQCLPEPVNTGEDAAGAAASARCQAAARDNPGTVHRFLRPVKSQEFPILFFTEVPLLLRVIVSAALLSSEPGRVEVTIGRPLRACCSCPTEEMLCSKSRASNAAETITRMGV